jgi:small-conductance mechanosensitive channel
MALPELLNILALAFALMISIFVFNRLLRRTVKSSHRGLFFKFGIVVIFTLLVILLPNLTDFLNTSQLSTPLKMMIECLWWFSLNLLANEIITFFVWDKFLRNKGVTVSKLLRDIVGFSLTIITIALIFHFVFHRSVVGLFTASGVMAIILGYSAQATLGEAFAGVGLNITKQFEEGDWIGLAGCYGQVVEINWRFVLLLTLDGNFLSIPNSQVTKANIVNYSLPDPLHGISIKVPVKYTIPPEKVKKMLITAATQSFKVATEPQPVVSLIDLQSENNLFQLIYHTTEPNSELVTDEILSIFWYQCKRIEATINEEANRFSQAFSTDEITRFIQSTDLFSSLETDDVNLLIEQSTYKIYGPPEQILTQGQHNQSLFLIFSGYVDVYIKTPDDKMTKVASLGKGQYFGEMSLLTGDPAGASILAGTECIVIEINHENIAKIFEKHPSYIEKISEVVILRKLQNENVRAAISNNTKQEKQSLISQLANRVRNFFKSTF